MCAGLCLFVCVLVCMCMYVCVSTRTVEPIRNRLDFTYVCWFVLLCMCASVCVCVCVCVCMCVSTHTVKPIRNIEPKAGFKPTILANVGASVLTISLSRHPEAITLIHAYQSFHRRLRKIITLVLLES